MNTPRVRKPNLSRRNLTTPENLQVNEAQGFNEKEYGVIEIEFDIAATALPPRRLCVYHAKQSQSHENTACCIMLTIAYLADIILACINVTR